MKWYSNRSFHIKIKPCLCSKAGIQGNYEKCCRRLNCGAPTNWGHPGTETSKTRPCPAASKPDYARNHLPPYVQDFIKLPAQEGHRKRLQARPYALLALHLNAPPLLLPCTGTDTKDSLHTHILVASVLNDCTYGETNKAWNVGTSLATRNENEAGSNEPRWFSNIICSYHPEESSTHCSRRHRAINGDR